MKQQQVQVKNYHSFTIPVILFLSLWLCYDAYVSWYVVQQNSCSNALIDLMGYKVKTRQSLNAFYTVEGGVLHDPRCTQSTPHSVSVVWSMSEEHLGSHPLVNLWVNTVDSTKMIDTKEIRMWLSQEKHLCFRPIKQTLTPHDYCFQAMDLISPINQSL